MIRIGHGYDCHAFCAGTGLPIGGVHIACDRGVKAHSDGDVLLHAISDALLGAAALGDLGRHFPDTDMNIKSIASKVLLEQIVVLLQSHSWQVVNVDATVITQLPRLMPHIEAMCANIGEILNIPTNHVSVKATTSEKMGWIGREEGLAAHAVVLIESVSTD